MYNRYIPQPDGTYRRSRIPSPPPPPPPVPEQIHPEPMPCPPEPVSASCETCIHAQPVRPPQNHRPTKPQSQGVGSFLRQLLPKDFDTEDLLVVLLLLLMAEDCRDDQNLPLLTLALYLFL